MAFAGALLAGAGALPVTAAGQELPPALAKARNRLTLEQPGSRAFHLEVRFESTSDTGVKCRGTFTQDWWTDLWWREVTVVDGRRREVVQIAGRPYRDEDDKFVLPLRAERLLLALRRPFPERPQPAGTESTLQLAAARLRCSTLPAGAAEPGLKPAPKTFCVDEAGDLRMTADPMNRVVYNDMAAMGSRVLAREVQMIQGGETVAALHVMRLSERADGPVALQAMSMDEQIRFALANPRLRVELQPAWMQRQLLSIDARLLPHGAIPLRADERFAMLRVLEADGRLVDAEVLGASDEATRSLALKILRTATFRVPPPQPHALLLEGVLLLAQP